MKMKLSVFTSLFAPYVTSLGESTVEVFDPFSRAQGLSGFDAWVKVLCGMWSLPGPGVGLVSSASAGGFVSTLPPGKSY